MKTGFWRINEDRFRYSYYDSMSECTSEMANKTKLLYYDYATTDPKQIGRRLGLQINVTPPLRFDLGAFMISGLDAIDKYESKPIPERTLYLKNKTELETDGFALTPPVITNVPSYRGEYDHLSQTERPIAFCPACYGEICLLKKDGGEIFECNILHKLGCRPHSVSASTLLVKPCDDKKRKIDLECHEDIHPKPEP